MTKLLIGIVIGICIGAWARPLPRLLERRLQRRPRGDVWKPAPPVVYPPSEQRAVH